jgi:hypothetical protein
MKWLISTHKDLDMTYAMLWMDLKWKRWVGYQNQHMTNWKQLLTGHWKMIDGYQYNLFVNILFKTKLKT